MVSNIPGVQQAVLSSQRQLTKNGQALGRSLERLATSFKVNRASDDAAGFAAAEKLLTSTRGSQAAFDAVQTAVNVGNIADGALNGISENTQRIRELSIQAASDTNGPDQRAAIQGEIDQLLESNDQIAQGTQFNGKQLLDGSAKLSIPTDENATAVQLDISDARSAALGLISVDVSTTAGAQAAIDSADTALNRLGDNRAGLGATLNRFDSVANNLTLSIENTTVARGRIIDTDYAAESANLTKALILQNSAKSVFAQANRFSTDLTKLLA